jgi:glycosyltransferase involved in cell wall biosynthesis
MSLTKPRVLIIIDTATIGGPGKGLFQLVQRAEACGFEYVLCNFRYKRARNEEFIERAGALGLNLRLLTQRFRFDPKALVEALELARYEGCNIVQSHGYKGHLIALVLKWYYGLPWIAFEHGFTAEDWKVRQYQRLQLLAARFADLAVAVSPVLYATLDKLRGPARPTVLISNAVDPGEVRPGGESVEELRRALAFGAEDVLLGVFGRLSPEKGQIQAIRALAKLLPSRPNVKLLLLGDGPQRTALEHEASRLKVETAVRFVGYQSAPRAYFELLTLLVLPSLSEGLPNVVLEAMSLAVPVVATRVGAVPDVIEDRENGWLVAAGDPAALAATIDAALASRERLRAVALNGQKSVLSRFNADARAKQISELYFKVLPNTPPSP